MNSFLRIAREIITSTASITSTISVTTPLESSLQSNRARTQIIENLNSRSTFRILCPSIRICESISHKNLRVVYSKHRNRELY